LDKWRCYDLNGNYYGNGSLKLAKEDAVKKGLFGLLAVVLVLVMMVGCSNYVETPKLPPTSDAESLPSQPSTNEATQGSGVQPPDDMNWISPGKVIVTNFYPGARAEYPITVHNGNSVSTSFTIACRPADHVDEPYVKAPPYIQDWVMVVDPTPVLAARETRDILVTLEMPEDAEVFAPQWEFWISALDTSQGMIKTEVAVRWLVTMR
jgi:hypothetical protein